jgi:hypothetical protein
MSPVNRTRSAGSQASVSPRVWAGPTSSRRTSRDPTRSDSSPLNVSPGGAGSIPVKSNGSKQRRKKSPSVPMFGACCTSAAIAAGGSSCISAAVRSEATIRAPTSSWLP